ncbi:uncharacterized protein K452DRAFT_205478, partial [Aplosporella prunicola CBS 121167]
AIERNDADAIASLLRKGADPNISTTRSGWTSIHYIARAQSENEEIIALLIAHGARVNALDSNSQTPLSRAIRHNNAAAKLKALVKAGADPNMQYDEAKWSASHLAVFIGQKACVRALLKAGADFSLKTVLGTNVITFTAKYG